MGAGGDNRIFHNNNPLRFPYVLTVCDPIIFTRICNTVLGRLLAQISLALPVCAPA
jgi:hypothetical protein